MNDNRNYQYGLLDKANRKEYPIIYNWVKPKSKVLDLGCGEGSLLAFLGRKEIRGTGIEISRSGVAATKKKGFPAFEGRIDKTLKYKANSFDYTVCNVTLSMVMYPEVLLHEMVRISKKQIISFPNFAFLLNRLELLYSGKMPHWTLGGYSWYSTGQIHQLSIVDFERLIRQFNVRITKKAFIYPSIIDWIPQNIKQYLPSSLAMIALFQLEKI